MPPGPIDVPKYGIRIDRPMPSTRCESPNTASGWYIAVCSISLSPSTLRSVFNKGQTVTARGAGVDRNHAVAADDEAGLADAPRVGLAELTGRAAHAADAGRDLDPRS